MTRLLLKQTVFRWGLRLLIPVFMVWNWSAKKYELVIQLDTGVETSPFVDVSHDLRIKFLEIRVFRFQSTVVCLQFNQ